jgi:hypothetical protein
VLVQRQQIIEELIKSRGQGQGDPDNSDCDQRSRRGTAELPQAEKKALEMEQAPIFELLGELAPDPCAP